MCYFLLLFLLVQGPTNVFRANRCTLAACLASKLPATPHRRQEEEKEEEEEEQEEEAKTAKGRQPATCLEVFYFSFFKSWSSSERRAGSNGPIRVLLSARPPVRRRRCRRHAVQ